MELTGRYPKKLLAAWEELDKQTKSDNDNPRMFGTGQHFLILASENGGTTLEKYEVFKN